MYSNSPISRHPMLLASKSGAGRAGLRDRRGGRAQRLHSVAATVVILAFCSDCPRAGDGVQVGRVPRPSAYGGRRKASSVRSMSTKWPIPCTPPRTGCSSDGPPTRRLTWHPPRRRCSISSSTPCPLAERPVRHVAFCRCAVEADRASWGFRTQPPLGVQIAWTSPAHRAMILAGRVNSYDDRVLSWVCG